MTQWLPRDHYAELMMRIPRYAISPRSNVNHEMVPTAGCAESGCDSRSPPEGQPDVLS